MKKQLLGTLLVLMFLAPQTGLVADDDNHKHNHKHKDKSPKPLKTKLFNSINVHFATKAELAELRQAIEDIDPNPDIADFKLKLGELSAELGELLDTVNHNSSDISLALTDILGIMADIQTISGRLGGNEILLGDLKSALADISAKLAALESTVGDHESRLLALEQSGSPEKIIFSGVFTQGAAPSAESVAAWEKFIFDAGFGLFKSIEIRNDRLGGGGGSVACSIPETASEIARALSTHTLGSLTKAFKCGSVPQSPSWNVGDCGPGVGLSTTNGTGIAVCNCVGYDAVVSPFKDSENWGGVNSFGGICGAPSQTLEVILTR